MFHIARVLKVFKSTDKEIVSSDSSTQAIVRMWDQNQFTFLVDASLSSEVKEGSVVLVDYTPQTGQAPIPKNTVVKVLKGELGKKSWELFQQYDVERRKRQGDSEEAPPRNLFT